MKKVVKSDLPLNYVTIKTTKSRIDKGLMAIPVSLIDLFPKKKSNIFLVNEYGNIEPKAFTPYNSSSRECRIGGLREFYRNYKVIDGEELVIQLLDDNKFKIIPEKLFTDILRSRFIHFENSQNDSEVESILSQISEITSLSKFEILKNKFISLSMEKNEDRKFIKKSKSTPKERAPYFIRKILLELYSGKCQVSGFTFLTKKHQPYFELHHIDPEKGNHLKNLLVVSPNVHAQFTHASIKQYFDNDGWLRKVKFGEDKFNIFQIIDSCKKKFKKEIHF